MESTSDQVTVAIVIGATTVTNGLIGLIGLTINRNLRRQGVPAAPVTTSTLVEGMALQINDIAARLGGSTQPPDRAAAYQQVISDLETHLDNGGSSS